jgi:hypothetical protein
VISLISTPRAAADPSRRKQARQRTCRLPHSTSNIEMSIISLEG